MEILQYLMVGLAVMGAGTLMITSWALALFVVPMDTPTSKIPYGIKVGIVWFCRIFWVLIVAIILGAMILKK